MSYERDLSAIFGRKAEEFTEHHKLLLRRVWDCGRREGVHQTHEEVKDVFRRTEFDAEDLGEEVPLTHRRFSPELLELMQGLWRASFEGGRGRGQKRIDIIFTHVISKEPLHEVFDMDSPSTPDRAHTGNVSVRFKPWVIDAFQEVLDAPDLESAKKAADEAKAEHRRRGKQVLMRSTGTTWTVRVTPPWTPDPGDGTWP